MPKPWKLLSSKTVLQNPYVNIRQDHVQLENGKEIDDFFVFEFNDWARIVPVTIDKQLIVIEQYRHGVEQVTFEFPAGGHDAEDESMLMTAQRELLEETGYQSNHWVPLGSFKLGPSRIKNGFHLFLALDCEQVATQTLDDSEEIEVHTISFDEFDTLMDSGKILDTDSALAWQLCKSKNLI